MRPKLYLAVGQAGHFLRWERPEFARHFELVDHPAHDVAVHGFGPDVLEEVASVPAAHRSILVLPGFRATSPFFDGAYRDESAAVLRGLDAVFVNPGPLAAAYAGLPNLTVVDFSVDVDALPSSASHRTTLDSLLHASADYPQKDWRRSREVMRRTGLRHEVFPPRRPGGVGSSLTTATKAKRKLNYWSARVGLGARFDVPRARYVDHRVLIRKYLEHDGFVHVAAPTPPVVDGLYTATLMEAGCTGALLFWHDTHQLGGFLETVFELPVDPSAAAERILDIRASVDVRAHSEATRAEVADRFAPGRAVGQRCAAILAALA